MNTNSKNNSAISARAAATRCDFNISADPYNYIRRLLFQPWKPAILRAIYLDEKDGGSEHINMIPIPKAQFNKKLTELLEDGLIYRIVYTEKPLCTSLHLTDSGESMISVLDMVYEYGRNDMLRKGYPVDPILDLWHGFEETLPEKKEVSDR